MILNIIAAYLKTAIEIDVVLGLAKGDGIDSVFNGN